MIKLARAVIPLRLSNTFFLVRKSPFSSKHIHNSMVVDMLAQAEVLLCLLNTLFTARRSHVKGFRYFDNLRFYL